MSNSDFTPPKSPHISFQIEAQVDAQVEQYWLQLCAFIAQQAKVRGLHLSRCVVLLPYAQLMPLARRYWAQAYPNGFVPAFQSTQNWASQVRAFALDANDISFDVARDVLTATSLVEHSGIAGADMAQRDLLAQRLVEAAHQLANCAAAISPDKRLDWAAQMRTTVFNNTNTPSFQWLHWESALARLALAWVSTSSYASDVLFDDALVKSQVDGLFVLEGFQRDALVRALTAHWGDKAVLLPPPELTAIDPLAHHISLHKTQNAQDEAQRSAACVLQHVAAGRIPVALAATDRALTRRIRAMLATQNVAVRDENGWKLSTTRAAAHVMSSLSACAWNASSDSVLDWLKNCSAATNEGVVGVVSDSFVTDTQVQTLEKELRRAGTTVWSSWVAAARRLADEASVASLATTESTVEAIEALRTPLQKPRPLAARLLVLRQLLQTCGLWDTLLADLAGEKVITVLHLTEGSDIQLTELPQAQRRISLAEFTAWVDVALESESFVPAYPDASQVTQVVILPMSQLFARPFAAAVLPGCDEVRLNPSPELPGLWSAAERKELGLTTREEQDTSTRAAWQYALQTPHCDVLWRAFEGSGEPILPSSLVQSLALTLNMAQPVTTAAEPRAVRAIEAAPTARPLPVASELPVTKLSASGYDKLRTCPYQFFALQQLGLQENDELEDELGKRDFGNWLHAVLSHFHENLAEKLENSIKIPVAVKYIDKLALINIASEEVTHSMKLPEDAFLPWATMWPRVRDGYLKWLEGHEKMGWIFAESEAWKEQALGGLKLVGKIDRIDRSADGELMVLDYKTENDGKTSKRVKDPYEDTQLAFYGALMEADALQAGYINVSEKLSKTYPQTEIVDARDALIEGILDDMKRIGEGAALPALGEGTACDYCAARGLCRKDFWE